MKKILPAIAAAMLLAGCAGTTPTTPVAVAQATPTVVYVTPAPTLAPTPTPRPTPVPTPTIVPTPTPVPTPEPTADTRFLDFLNRSVTWDGRMMDLTGSISDEVSLFDTDSAAADARQLKSDSAAFVKWLDGHKPASCYKDLWTLNRSAASDIASAMGYWIRWLDAFPYGTDADLNHGGSYITRATTSVSDATGELDNVSCP